MAQDDKRESEQIKIFGLKKKSNSNRGSRYLPDAVLSIDGKTYDFELYEIILKIFIISSVEC